MFRYSRRTLVREALTILAALLLMLPFYFLINISLKSDADAINSSAISLPNPVSGGAYASAWAGSATRSIPHSMINSFVITAGSLVVLIFVGSITAYTLSRVVGRLSRIIFGLFVLAIILPFQLGMVPLYVTLRSVGLVGSLVGMIVLYSGLLLPLAVFLYSGFVESLPREYEEAASLDGSSPFQTFRRIIFPLLSPATGTVAILCGLIIWNDFLTPLVFLSGTSNATLPVVIYGFVGEQISRWNVIFAAVAISMVPILAFYLAAQKKFIQGFAGGIKS
jgi:raffinose/stachyose/melibiose transport system permease protein